LHQACFQRIDLGEQVHRLAAQGRNIVGDHIRLQAGIAQQQDRPPHQYEGSYRQEDDDVHRAKAQGKHLVEHRFVENDEFEVIGQLPVQTTTETFLGFIPGVGFLFSGGHFVYRHGIFRLPRTKIRKAESRDKRKRSFHFAPAEAHPVGPVANLPQIPYL